MLPFRSFCTKKYLKIMAFYPLTILFYSLRLKERTALISFYNGKDFF
jgi:hypothetical protein